MTDTEYVERTGVGPVHPRISVALVDIRRGAVSHETRPH